MASPAGKMPDSTFMPDSASARIRALRVLRILASGCRSMAYLRLRVQQFEPIPRRCIVPTHIPTPPSTPRAGFWRGFWRCALRSPVGSVQVPCFIGGWSTEDRARHTLMDRPTRRAASSTATARSPIFTVLPAPSSTLTPTPASKQVRFAGRTRSGMHWRGADRPFPRPENSWLASGGFLNPTHLPSATNVLQPAHAEPIRITIITVWRRCWSRGWSTRRMGFIH